jgi:hypothetical protein
MNDENNGASSTPEELEAASSDALAANDFASYEQAENAREGKAAPPQPTKPEAAAPSKDNADPAPDAATGKPVQEQRKPRTGEDRKAELAAEIADLLRQKAELQGKYVPAAAAGDKGDPPPPAKVEPPVEKRVAAQAGAPKKPFLSDKKADGSDVYASYGEFDDAKEAWLDEMIEFRAGQAIAARETAQTQAAADKVISDRWDAQVEAGKKEHADFAEIAFSKATPITNAMDGFILDPSTEHGAEILYKLGENGSAEGKRIAALPAYAAVRALLAIENSLGKPEKRTPVKTHSSAPSPATDLGARNTEPADRVQAALVDGDYARYEREANARDLKARTG